MIRRLKGLWGDYMFTGGLLAIPMAMSYFYGLSHMVMHMGDPGLKGGFYPMLVAFGWCFIMPLSRAVLWGPSFILWLYAGHHHFLYWLAPGFYEPAGVWHL